MSSQNFKFTEDISPVPDASDMRIGFIVSEWNNNITNKLLSSAIETLKEHGMKDSNITVRYVPGSFELVYGSALLAKSGYVDAIIALGCVVRGDTPHFDYICQGATQGLTTLNTTGQIPVINGILTVNNMQQAEDRTGGAAGDKGKEFAITAIKMIDFAWQIQK
jgi:6,7-dimethyl-8-ribityllumazine synthase